MAVAVAVGSMQTVAARLRLRRQFGLTFEGGDVGNRGRRTGFRPQSFVARDADGLENIDAFWGEGKPSVREELQDAEMSTLTTPVRQNNSTQVPMSISSARRPDGSSLSRADSDVFLTPSLSSPSPAHIPSVKVSLKEGNRLAAALGEEKDASLEVSAVGEDNSVNAVSLVDEESVGVTDDSSRMPPRPSAFAFPTPAFAGRPQSGVSLVSPEHLEVDTPDESTLGRSRDPSLVPSRADETSVTLEPDEDGIESDEEESSIFVPGQTTLDSSGDMSQPMVSMDASEIQSAQRRRATSTVEQGGRGRRMRYKPLERWRGERVEYYWDDEAGLPAVKDVVRVEGQGTPAFPRHKQESRRPLPRPSAVSVVTPEGVEKVKEIAMTDAMLSYESAPRIATPGAPAGSCQIASVFASPAWTLQVVRLRPGGLLPARRTEDMEVFYVSFGLVKVTVHMSAFTIGAGGHFFIPANNIYSLENAGKTIVKLVCWAFAADGGIGSSQEVESSVVKRKSPSKPKSRPSPKVKETGSVKAAAKPTAAKRKRSSTVSSSVAGGPVPSSEKGRRIKNVAEEAEGSSLSVIPLHPDTGRRWSTTRRRSAVVASELVASNAAHEILNPLSPQKRRKKS